jgi:hypothetical protein
MAHVSEERMVITINLGPFERDNAIGNNPGELSASRRAIETKYILPWDDP